MDPPTRTDIPNCDVLPLVKLLNCVAKEAWQLGLSFSVDEIIICFKGKHKYKRRVTYKAEGGGFQANALCQEGYAYQVCMINDPAPKKYLRQGFSPMHYRVMIFLDSLDYDHHQCSMDNLYNSASFCPAVYNHEKKLPCHGVAKKLGQGVPEAVNQEEQKSNEYKRRVRGTVKADALEEDPE